MAQSLLSKSGIKVMMGFELNNVTFSDSNSVYSINLVCIPGSPNFEKYEERKKRDRERAERKAKIAAERNEEFWNVEEVMNDEPDFDELILCGTLLLSETFHADIDVFSAINDSGLVYDGGIVVDSNFCTVDPCIFAVGDCSRFSRIHTDAVPIHTINSRELGTYVAVKVIETHLDPQIESFGTKNEISLSQQKSIAGGLSSTSSSSASKGYLPKFSLPKTTCATLPGGMYLLRSCLPNVSNRELVSMVTGGPETNRICVVKTDPFGLVVEITYIGTEEVEGRNIGRLVGWHESYLNNACFAFETGHISDWMEFFRESWASFLYHDNFTSFAGTLKNSLLLDKGTFLLQDELLEIAETCKDDGILSLERRKIVGNRGENAPETTRAIVESHTLDFLRKNKGSFSKIFIPPVGGLKLTHMPTGDPSASSKK
jgi:hypothetical protein